MAKNRARRNAWLMAADAALSFDPAALALFARMTTPPSSARKQVINNTIRSLKAAGIWAKLDALYLTAAHSAQAGQRNWIADQYNLSPQSSPTFTADRGYAGDGAAAYLDTGFNPTTAVSPKFVQDSAHVSVWNRTSRAAADTSLLGSRNGTTSYINLIPRSSGDAFIGRVNGPTNTLSVANTASAGHFIGNRSASTASQGYRNGASVSTSAAASVTPPNANVLLLARSVVSSTPDTFATDEVAAASIGASLTSDEAAALYSALNAYLVAVGAA